MLKIVYFSKTKNVERFVQKIPYETINGNEIKKIDNDYILLIYTTGYGQVPLDVINFLESNHQNLKGVISSGNVNWGEYYGAAADIIGKKYKCDVLMKFELSGNIHDVAKFNTIYERMNNEI